MGAGGEVDMSKLCSVEQIREYLESELGAPLLMKIYPIIKAFGDDILFTDKIQDLKDQLKPHLTGQQVDRYHIMFSTLVFYELEIEKAFETGPKMIDLDGLDEIIEFGRIRQFIS